MYGQEASKCTGSSTSVSEWQAGGENMLNYFPLNPLFSFFFFFCSQFYFLLSTPSHIFCVSLLPASSLSCLSVQMTGSPLSPCHQSCHVGEEWWWGCVGVLWVAKMTAWCQASSLFISEASQWRLLMWGSNM